MGSMLSIASTEKKACLPVGPAAPGSSPPHAPAGLLALLTSNNAAPVRQLRWLLAAGCCLLAQLSVVTWAAAAELRLRSRCEATRPVVTLGDVADVLATTLEEAERLQGVELFPAPLPGQVKYLNVREFQDVLLLRGVDLVPLRMTGAAQVTIERPSSDSAPAQSGAALGLGGQWQRQIAAAVEDHLRRQCPNEATWRVSVALRDDQVALLSRATALTGVSGGRPPWHGSQQFQVAMETADGPVFFNVATQVESVPPVLIAARTLPRGTIIQAGDVRLVAADSSQVPRDACRTLDEVVGAETVRAIPQGEVIGSPSVRAPILVRRGDAVTVFARAAGVQVRTIARARADAALGDLVALESPLDGSVFVARIIGLREAEVFARATTGRQAAAVGDRSPAAEAMGSTTNLVSRNVVARQVLNRPASLDHRRSTPTLQTAALLPQPHGDAANESCCPPPLTNRPTVKAAEKQWNSNGTD